MEGMNESILVLGEKYDRMEQAEKIVNNFEDKMAEIEEKVKDKEPPTVLILFGVPVSYLVATEDSYVGDLVRRAGGVNAVPDKGVEYIASNTENLRQSNPDIILKMAHGMPEEVVEMF
ncbi:MAG TPA: ABC transporter substrate-binding protein, partial [Bacillota bacterium]|nr:ABC transporter substrate-binding protein [Bacillota bacterium]